MRPEPLETVETASPKTALSRRTTLKISAWTAPVIVAASAIPAVAASRDLPGIDLVNTASAVDYYGNASFKSLGGSEGPVTQAEHYDSSGFCNSDYTHTEGFRYRFRVRSTGPAPLAGPITISFDIPYAGSFQYNGSDQYGNSNNYPTKQFSNGDLFKPDGGTINQNSAAKGRGRDGAMVSGGATWSINYGAIRGDNLPAGSNSTWRSKDYPTPGYVELTQRVTQVQRVTLKAILDAPLNPDEWIQIDLKWVIPWELRRPNGGYNANDYRDKNTVGRTWIQPEGLRVFTWYSMVYASTEDNPAEPAEDQLNATSSASAATPNGLYYFDGGYPMQFGEGSIDPN